MPEFRHLASLDDVSATAWDALHDGQPCLSHAYLRGLEQSGCITAESGWLPCHATLWDGDQLLAAMPLYEKHHSYGEYVFDWAWAEAYAQHGVAYYPKLLGAVPVTPIPGARLLGRTVEHRLTLLAGLSRSAMASELSSLHILFAEETEIEWMRQAGFMIRQGVQFHWQNSGYQDFDAFLACLNHDKRKKIRQERRKASAGLEFTWLDGHTANDDDWRFLFQCYALTYALHRSSPYLNVDFFLAFAAACPESVRLLRVLRDGTPIASAFFLADRNALYGRYWGALEYVPGLHFEVCYYQAIEYAIHHGLQRMEGGAQGEHKLARGLEPVKTYSAHWLRDARFADAVARYLDRETGGVEAWIDELDERRPFKRP